MLAILNPGHRHDTDPLSLRSPCQAIRHQVILCHFQPPARLCRPFRICLNKLCRIPVLRVTSRPTHCQRRQCFHPRHYIPHHRHRHSMHRGYQSYPPMNLVMPNTGSGPAPSLLLPPILHLCHLQARVGHHQHRIWASILSTHHFHLTLMKKWFRYNPRCRLVPFTNLHAVSILPASSPYSNAPIIIPHTPIIISLRN